MWPSIETDDHPEGVVTLDGTRYAVHRIPHMVWSDIEGTTFWESGADDDEPIYRLVPFGEVE